MIISTKNLSRTYGSGETAVHALKSINLSVKRGEFISVVGTSGSGKSTLLHLLGGLDRPTEGQVIIDDTSIYEMKADPLTIFRRRFIGFVFQSYNLIPNLNVWENIVLPLGLDGIKAKKDEVDSLLAVLGISDKRTAMPSQLSGGQQQRVAIARALATKPHIVLADEPTGNLDSKTGLEVLLTLRKLNEELGQTIIMITHNEELSQMASRRIRIEDGIIISDNSEVR